MNKDTPMRSKLPVLLALCLPLALTSAACAKESNAAPKAAPAAAPKAVAPVLAAYEHMRTLLADDKIADAVTHAKVLEAAAQKAASEEKASLKPTLEALAKAAAEVAKQQAEAPNDVRRAYGEVSRYLVAVFVDDAALQQGRFLFECPMAQGYPKWVQLEEKMMNPYMGKRMLQCGAKTDWKV
jgi:hypothetical protein